MKKIKKIIIILLICAMIIPNTYISFADGETVEEGAEIDDTLGEDTDAGTSSSGTNANGSQTMSGKWYCNKASFTDKISFTETIGSHERATVIANGRIYRSTFTCTSSNSFYIVDNGTETFWLQGYTKTSEGKERYLGTGTGSKGTTQDNVRYIMGEGTHNISIEMRHIKHPVNGTGAVNGYELTFQLIKEPYSTLKFDANGGEGSVPSPVNIGETYGTDIGSATPTRMGYDFRGWGYNPAWCSNRISYASTGQARYDGTSSSDLYQRTGGTSSAITCMDNGTYRLWTRSDYASALGVSYLPDETTVYAQWDPKYVPYTVKHYTMNLLDNGNDEGQI